MTRVPEVKKKLAKLGKRLLLENIIFPVAGNLSYRIGDENKIVVKKSGRGIEIPDHFILIDFQDIPLESGRPSSMAKVHCEILARRKDVNVVLHWRGVFTDVIADNMDHLPITPEVMFVVESEIPVIKLKKLTTKEELANWQMENVRKVMSEETGQVNSFITPFLGVWTIAKDIEEMYWRVKVIEMSAQTIVFKNLFSGKSGKTLETPQWLLNLAKK